MENPEPNKDPNIVYYSEEEIDKMEGKASKINKNIYIGDLYTAFNKDYLKELGITHILRVGQDIPDYYQDDFEYLSIDIKDKADSCIYVFFESAIKFIDDCIDEKGIVLVHCVSGISRSVSLVIAYFMKKKKINYTIAYDLVNKHRKIAWPNQGFVLQLKEFYLKRVVNLIKVPCNKFGWRSYSCCDGLKKFDYQQRYWKSKPKEISDEKRIIRTKKVNTLKAMIESSKIKLFDKMCEKYNEIKNLSKEDKRKELEQMVKKPTTTYNDHFDKIAYKSGNYYKLRKRRLTNLISREGPKFIEDIMKKHKN
jgi:protein-tyrosine phosphatase